MLRVPRKMTQSLRLLLAASLALLCSCASVGQYIWVDDLPQQDTQNAGYILAPGDLVQVRVYNQEGMSTRARLRSDGKISLPFLNDVEAAGYSPVALAQQLQTRLKEFVNLPVVTVSLEEAKPISVSVLGDVPRQGVYQIEKETKLSQVLALAGGLTDFAHKDRIFVVREPPQVPAPIRIRFSYERIARAEGRAARFALQSGDVVVVE